MRRHWYLVMALAAISCGTTTTSTGSDTSTTTTTSTCTLTDNTTATSTVTSNCTLLTRDTSACQASRTSQGLSGYWLKFSCRVTLTTSTTSGATVVVATADGQPDYKSNYFATSHACYEAFTGNTQNPNLISAQSYAIQFPVSTTTTAQTMSGGVVGLALNGVPIFDNAAAPGDDIYEEATTFDKCQAHPTQNGLYHYHSEPYAITSNDAHFVGVMRDGYPVYGRKDADGSTPTLDVAGGHTGVTEDSPSTAVYHYHINEQTSTTTGTVGQTQQFITTGTYRGTPGSCTGC